MINRIVFSALMACLAIAGCSRQEVITTADLQSDPSGIWIGDAASGSAELEIKPDGTLTWTQNGQSVAGKWKLQGAGSMEMAFPSGTQSYKFERTDVGIRLTDPNGTPLNFGMM